MSTGPVSRQRPGLAGLRSHSEVRPRTVTAKPGTGPLAGYVGSRCDLHTKNRYGSRRCIHQFAHAGAGRRSGAARLPRQRGVSCKIAISYANECAVMVVGRTGHNVNPGPSIAAATKKAMDVCRSDGDDQCEVYYSACSLPRRIQ
ncbi:DUF4189 domain-containing protein [Burkholderia cepacia]|uniref:DUF4189 domain-containing protein n=1 Tax=Burkholderia cepacia TaxID=292 RepID=UPI00158CF5DE